MSKQSIEMLEITELTDISNIHIRKDLPYENKIIDFLEQIKNPYCFRCGTTPVKVCFSKPGRSLETALQEFFVRERQC